MKRYSRQILVDFSYPHVVPANRIHMQKGLGKTKEALVDICGDDLESTCMFKSAWVSRFFFEKATPKTLQRDAGNLREGEPIFAYIHANP